MLADKTILSPFFTIDGLAATNFFPLAPLLYNIEIGYKINCQFYGLNKKELYYYIL